MYTALNAIIVGGLFFLPYYLFGSRMFLGGDDTRLFYVYPQEVLNALALYSWNTIASVPAYLENHHYLPFLTVLTGISRIIPSKTVLFHTVYAMPLVIGFIYFQKFVMSVFGRNRIAALTAALLYVLSPITVFSQLLYFLSPAWLIGAFPVYAYYFVQYLRTSKRSYISKAVLWAILFSFVNIAVPWIFGLLLPVGAALFVLAATGKMRWKHYAVRILVFAYFLVSSQLFWAIPFFMSVVHAGDLGIAVRVDDAAASFAATVNATATGNILHALFMHYNRQFIFDFNIPVKQAFTSFYDRIMPINVIFVLLSGMGIYHYRKRYEGDQRVSFIVMTVAFVISLFLFTVNLGPLRDAFIVLGRVPGFGIFRNFTDKFALGYVFVYATLLYACMRVSERIGAIRVPIIAIAFAVTVLNIVPIKSVIDSPIWGTKQVYRTVTMPDEYFDFMNVIRTTVPQTTNIFSLPQNIASYAIITEQNGRNAYVGLSPLKFFSGVNDLTGNGSYPPAIAGKIQAYVTQRKYDSLIRLLRQLNVSYVLVYTNIPEPVRQSYLYQRTYMEYQDQQLVEGITDGEAARSRNGSYVLYRLNMPSVRASTESGTESEKISPVAYVVRPVKNQTRTDITFLETYHDGWVLYPKEEPTGGAKASVTVPDMLNIVLDRRVPSVHEPHKPYGNMWTIGQINGTLRTGPQVGSAGTEGTGAYLVYFRPQLYFYIGLAATAVMLVTGMVALRFLRL